MYLRLWKWIFLPPMAARLPLPLAIDDRANGLLTAMMPRRQRLHRLPDQHPFRSQLAIFPPHLRIEERPRQGTTYPPVVHGLQDVIYLYFAEK